MAAESAKGEGREATIAQLARDLESALHESMTVEAGLRDELERTGQRLAQAEAHAVSAREQEATAVGVAQLKLASARAEAEELRGRLAEAERLLEACEAALEEATSKLEAQAEETAALGVLEQELSGLMGERDTTTKALADRVEALRAQLESRDAAVAAAEREAAQAVAARVAAEDDAATARVASETARREAALGRAALSEVDHLRRQLREMEGQVESYRAEAASAAVSANRSAAATRLTERKESFRSMLQSASRAEQSPPYWRPRNADADYGEAGHDEPARPHYQQTERSSAVMDEAPPASKPSSSASSRIVMSVFGGVSSAEEPRNNDTNTDTTLQSLPIYRRGDSSLALVPSLPQTDRGSAAASPPQDNRDSARPSVALASNTHNVQAGLKTASHESAIATTSSAAALLKQPPSSSPPPPYYGKENRQRSLSAFNYGDLTLATVPNNGVLSVPSQQRDPQQPGDSFPPVEGARWAVVAGGGFASDADAAQEEHSAISSADVMEASSLHTEIAELQARIAQNAAAASPPPAPSPEFGFLLRG
jgi:hypothetical protein